MVAAFIENARSILNALAPFEHLANLLMCLQLLELLIRVQERILIIETDDVTKVNQIGLHVVHERASVYVTRHRPVDCVHHVARLEMRIVWRNLPNLLQTKPIMLETCSIFV